MNTRAALLLACLAHSALVCAQADPAEEMQRQLEQRDQLIQDLQRRVETLEQKLQGQTPDTRAAAANPAGATAAPPASPSPDQPESSGAVEDETARALERTLVREGGLVLAPGVFEVEPGLLYTFRGSRGLGLVSLPSGAQIADHDLKQDRLEAIATLRAGLPWGTQAEIRMPYVWTREEASTAALGLSQTNQHSAWGDVQLQLTKQLVNEHGRMPALLASVNWKPDTGEFELGRLSAGYGFPSIQAGLTAVKRQDPLVFFGSISYIGYQSHNYNGNDIEPGDGVGLRFGAILAASPDTSLRAALDLSRYGNTRLNGASVPGSELVVGVLELGMSTLLSAKTLIDLSLGIGITTDAPDFRIGLSLPIRFN
ncbi:MAG: transporter [Burkholderiales bacterium]